MCVSREWCVRATEGLAVFCVLVESEAFEVMGPAQGHGRWHVILR